MPDNEILSFSKSCDWKKALDNRKLVDSAPAVYAIVSETAFGRLYSESRVLYIGKATCLGGDGDGSRLYGYRYQNTDSRDGRGRGLARKAMNLGHDLSLHWQVMSSEEEAAERETELLQQYIEHHLEVPPLNSKRK